LFSEGGKLRVLTTHSLPKEALRLLEGRVEVIDARGSSARVREFVGGADILLAGFMRIGREVLGRTERLRLIVAMSSGVDHIDVVAAEERGICVANQPEAIAEAVSEHVVGLVIASLRRIVEGHEYTVSGRWAREGKLLRGATIRGKTVGILGMGRIGSLAAMKLKLLGASRILYYSRSRKREVEQLLGAEPASIERVMEEADIIIAALPHSRETEGLLDYSLLSKMKRNALLVNVGRGTLVNARDLARILEERDDIRIAFDVHHEEPLKPGDPIVKLASTGRVILTPHHAGATDVSAIETPVLAARQVLHYIETGTVWNPVNRACREAKNKAAIYG
jgi:lactate dehydrogenase-like 2-hydroxyacid dehydrogenase